MIQFFKMINGEEIVAEIVDEVNAWDSALELIKPCRSIMTQKGMALGPYPCDRITINTVHILFSGVANTELRNAYAGLTGGVVVPANKIVTPKPTL